VGRTRVPPSSKASNISALKVKTRNVVRIAHTPHQSVCLKNALRACDLVGAFIPYKVTIPLGLAAVWCSTHDVSRIAIGSLHASFDQV